MIGPPDDMQRMIMDPRYAGLGGYPRIVEDDLWIRNNAKVLQEIGAAHYFAAQCAIIQPDKAHDPALIRTWVDVNISLLKEAGSREKFLTNFLADARREAATWDLAPASVDEQVFSDVNRKLH